MRRFADEVESAFPGLPITFLACNAGVVGGGSGVIFSSHDEWMKSPSHLPPAQNTPQIQRSNSIFSGERALF